MDSFLDSTTIIKYIEHDYIKEQLRKKCFEYIKFSNEKIFISFIVKEELRRVILKRKEMYECVLKKINDLSYDIEPKNTTFLNKEDVKFTQGLYIKLKDENIIDLKKDFDSEINFLNISLNLFLKNKVDEIAIAKSDLDNFILSVIHDFIDDFADCRVLTSAIQMQQNREQFLFVTADRHIDSGSYDFIESEDRLKDYKFPKLKNLLFES